MSPRDYWQILRRRWLAIVVSVVAGLATAGIATLTVPATYTAEASVVFSGHATTNGQDVAYIGSYVQSRMQTYRKLAESASVLQVVLGATRSREGVGELRDQIDVEVSQVNTLATVQVDSKNAKRAAATANALAAALVDAVRRVEGEGTRRATVDGVIVSKAEVPARPSDPNVPLYLLVGLFLGLIVGAVSAALREVLAEHRSSEIT
jgi:capsular polysaccharide biosynthesis protein